MSCWTQCISLDDNFFNELVISRIISPEVLDSLKMKFGTTSDRFSNELLKEIERNTSSVEKLEQLLLRSGHMEAARLLALSIENSDNNQDANIPKAFNLNSDVDVTDARGFNLFKSRENKAKAESIFNVTTGSKIFKGDDIYALSPGFYRGKVMIGM